MADVNVRAVITAKDEASAVLKKFGNSVESVGSSAAKALGDTVRTAALVGTVAIGGLAAAAVDMVNSFNESEKVSAQLNAVLKSTGGAAGVTAKAAEDLASSLQKVTTYSDEQILSAENLLLTFTKINKDIFPDTTKIVLDMSTALGQDLKSSAIQVGKALQDPILGVTALRRVGVNFSEAQAKVIKNLVETGKSAEAQALIMKELQTEFGGSAVAAGKTFAGSLTILKNQLDDIKEGFGKLIVDAITPFTKALADFVSSDRFQEWTDKARGKLKQLWDGFLDFAKMVWPTVKAALGEVRKTFDEWIIPAIQKTIDKVKEWRNQNPLLAEIALAVGAIGIAMSLNPFVTFVGLAITAITLLHQHWGEITTFIKDKYAEVGAAIEANPFLDIIRDSIVRIYTAVRDNLIPNIQNLLAQFNSEDMKVAAQIIGVVLYGAFVLVLRAVEGVVNQVSTLIGYFATLMRYVNDFKNSAKDLVGGAAGNFLNPLGAISNFIAGKRAEGGPVSGNTPYLVGERGPELFVPNNSGTIVPNGKGGSNQTVNVTFNGVFTGNEQEFRKLAVKMMGAFNDAQGMGNI